MMTRPFSWIERHIAGLGLLVLTITAITILLFVLEVQRENRNLSAENQELLKEIGEQQDRANLQQEEEGEFREQLLRDIAALAAQVETLGGNPVVTAEEREEQAPERGFSSPERRSERRLNQGSASPTTQRTTTTTTQQTTTTEQQSPPSSTTTTQPEEPQTCLTPTLPLVGCPS